MQPSAHCPSCQLELTGAMTVGHERRPKPGDFTICIDCSAVLVYATVKPWTFRLATEGERRELMNLETGRLALDAIRTVRGKHDH